MRKIALTLAIAAVGTAGFAGDGQIRRPDNAELIPDSYIVVLNDDMVAARGTVGFTVQHLGIDKATRHGGSVTHF